MHKNVSHILISEEKIEKIVNTLAKQIEKEMVYPGQIKVNVIRESRAIDIAK